MKIAFKKSTLAIATLSGTIIGVGIFSLPYITARVGFGLMFLYLFVLTVLVTLIHLCFSEVALKTPDFLRLPGYAKVHLGNWGKMAATVIAIFGSVGALLAYIIIGGGFLANLLVPVLGGSVFLYTILYFILGAFFIFWGIKAISKIEFWGLVLFFLSLLFILWRGLPFFEIKNLPFQFVNNLGDLFLPYGPILFALWGATMIPEVEEMLGHDKKTIKKVVAIASIIPVIFYLLFIVLVVSISGSATSTEAILGLKNVLGQKVASIMFFVGFLVTFTSFITIGLTLKKVFWYDLKMPHYFSWVLACSLPFLLYLLGFQDFIKVVGLVGGAMLAFEGVLILLMYQKIKQGRAKFFVRPLILIFLIGIIYEIIYFF
ncbi:hypothetical protein KKE19_03435 [Patescibacteria group bacterium]|nr:hypothetical protein [Patescibacteria group bacterium]MBU4367990.1 hypothetical protein [Patescibacteria group bacterium]MBU4462171.1 hypothetical protein [Patescibacteria group bacterium]MCG2699834.1 hypothetical protein [Candidatus Parcubacteria bacterium]